MWFSKNKEKKQPVLITGVEIARVLRGKRIPHHIADSVYWCPTRQWLQKLERWHRADLKRLKLEKWEDTWDCDNFAYRLFTTAQALYAWNPVRGAQGVALGVTSFSPEEGKWHMINFVVDENRRHDFIEGQTCRPRRLTPAQEDTTRLVLV